METILVLFILSFVAGVIAGFGGSSAFIPIVGLIFLTSLTTTEISGTAATSFFIATLFGSVLYWKSGDHDRQLLSLLVPPAIIGTQIGVYINGFITPVLFNRVIGIIAIILGVLLLRPILLTKTTEISFDKTSVHGKVSLIFFGLFVGVIAGLTGIGGIPLIVPALLIFNIHPLTSIATGFAVPTFNTLFTSIAYIRQGAVQFDYVLYIAVPFALAQIIGWKISRRIDITNLKFVLAIFNILLGGYLLIY